MFHVPDVIGAFIDGKDLQTEIRDLAWRVDIRFVMRDGSEIPPQILCGLAELGQSVADGYLMPSPMMFTLVFKK